jgi:hypothetical protein
MSPLNFNQNPQYFAQIFAQYIRAAVMILVWIIVAIASLAGAYVAVRMIWMAVLYLQQAVGV